MSTKVDVVQLNWGLDDWLGFADQYGPQTMVHGTLILCAFQGCNIKPNQEEILLVHEYKYVLIVGLVQFEN